MADEEQITPEGDVDAETTEATEDETETLHRTELQKERERAEKAERALAEARYKESERKRRDAETLGLPDDEDKPLTRKELDAALAADRERTKKELLAGTIAQEARKLAKSDAEAEHIIEVHRNRVFPEGTSLIEQLEEAQAIANRRINRVRTEQLERGLRSKETATTDSGGTYRIPPKAGEPNLPEQDLIALKQDGFVWNGTDRVFEKKLSSGKRIVRLQNGKVEVR